MNTGFGGSADTRTAAVEELQQELVRGLHYGILYQPWEQCRPEASREKDSRSSTMEAILPLNDLSSTTSMPEAWVRAAMLIRLNSLASGASGVSTLTIRSLEVLLQKNIVPRVPLRGSISASGDLSPLSYIAGLMLGKPTVTAWTGDESAGSRRIVRADRALASASLAPIKLGAKEGLAIVNGTAVSAAVGALAMHEAHCQAVLSQLLTAMTVEALCGTDESFDSFIAQVRPHPGQIESARNTYGFLSESKLVFRSDGSIDSALRQDRYSIRTASQWIGPVLEDLVLSHQQVTIELNSVTDNPLVDTKGKRMIHGGNFQARAITSAMEKVRQGCQTLGRMLSVQCTELINPATNRGLPPNLVVDEPSESFLWKGTDIMVAALQSELGFLANPVGSHVQTAEMGNQALNSLALISARYTLDALDILTQLSSAHLVALCQALDLRAMNKGFLETFAPIFFATTQNSFHHLLEPDEKLVGLLDTLWTQFKARLQQASTMDVAPRFHFVMDSLYGVVLSTAPASSDTLIALNSWVELCEASAIDTYNATREAYLIRPNATPYLGKGSTSLYTFVRKRLRIPFVQEETLTVQSGNQTGTVRDDESGQTFEPLDTPTMGDLIKTVHQSMISGELYTVVMECLEKTASIG